MKLRDYKLAHFPRNLQFLEKSEITAKWGFPPKCYLKQPIGCFLMVTRCCHRQVMTKNTRPNKIVSHCPSTWTATVERVKIRKHSKKEKTRTKCQVKTILCLKEPKSSYFRLSLECQAWFWSFPCWSQAFISLMKDMLESTTSMEHCKKV